MRRRLITLAAATSALIAIAFVVPLAVVVRQLAHDRAVTNAEADSQVLALSLTASGDSLDSAARALVATSGRPLTVVLPDGTVVGEPLQPGEDTSVPASGTAGRAVLDGGEAVYAPALTPDGVSVVRVFVDDVELTAGVTRSWLVIGLLGVGLVLVAVALFDRMGRSLRRPIDDLADAASRIGAGDLDTRVQPAGPPELETVGRQFNQMAADVRDLLQREREMAADLSHRLRTPLMAMRLGIDQVDDADRRWSLLEDMATLERAVDAVIDETRRPGSVAAATPVLATLRDRFGFWAALAEDQGRPTDLDVRTGEIDVALPRAQLEAAFDALIGNIFEHTGEGTGYVVSAVGVDDAVTVRFDDDGPGFSEAAAHRGSSGAGSTGLGLDIARRVAETTGGSLVIGTNPNGGARVELTLAAPATDDR